MAHGPKDSNEKIVYVGDSRVKKNTKVYLPADYTSFPGKSEAFIPNFLLKEWMVGAVVLVGFLCLTMSHPAPLGYPADPTNGTFIPMPDWYFLFMYQLLKYPYLADQYVVLGTLVIPGLLFGALTLAPFLDTGKERRFYRRPIASSLMVLSVIAVFYLTIVSWQHYEHELEANGIVPEHKERAAKMEEAKKNEEAGIVVIDPAELPIVDADGPGADLVAKATCIACHGDTLKGNSNMGVPPLRGVGDIYSQEELLGVILNGVGKMPAMEETAKDAGLSDQDIEQLAEWLSKQKAPVEG